MWINIALIKNSCDFIGIGSWSIDLMLGTPPAVQRLQKIWIDKAPRGWEKPSDHTFLVAEFKE